MRKQRQVSWEEVTQSAQRLFDRCGPEPRLWGIPRGGTYVSAVLAGLGARIAPTPQDADLAVDDIIDSGRTAARIKAEFGLETLALYDRASGTFEEWLVFPWEAGKLELDARDTITRLIQQLGDDPNRPGLRKTPERVVNGWRQRFSGYRQARNGAAALHLLENATEEPGGNADIDIIRGIEFHSTCERHIQPFHGALDIAWRRRDGGARRGSISASTMARLVNAHARRLTTQEQLTAQVARAIAGSGRAHAVLVRSTASHLCADGECQTGVESIREALHSPPGTAGGIETQLREALTERR